MGRQSNTAQVLLSAVAIIVAVAVAQPGDDDDPIEVSTVRSIDYREAAVAAALALVVTAMRVLASTTAGNVNALRTSGILVGAIILSIAFAALAVVLPRTVGEQSQYAWQWFHAVCPFVFLLPLPVFAFRGSKSPVYGVEEDSGEVWNMSMSVLFRELSLIGRVAFALIWTVWIGLASFLGAYDSLVFYLAGTLALEVGLTLPLAPRRHEHAVLPAAYGGGCELQLGISEGIRKARLMRLTADGVNSVAVPADHAAFRGEDSSTLEHRLPFAPSQPRQTPRYEQVVDSSAFSVALRGIPILSESAGMVSLTVEREEYDLDELRESMKGDVGHRRLISIGEVETSLPDDNHESSKEVSLVLPEDICGIYVNIARSFSPYGSFSHAFSWDDALSLGKALSAHRLIGLETGGYFAGIYEQHIAKVNIPKIALPLGDSLFREGHISFDLSWGHGDHGDSSDNGSSDGGSCNGDRSDSDSLGSAPVGLNMDDYLSDEGISLRPSVAAWEWLKTEHKRKNSALSSFISLWSTLDQVNELHTIVERQDVWSRMWLVSRNCARIRSMQRMSPEVDGVHRLVDRVAKVAFQTGRYDMSTSGLSLAFVIPTPAIVILALVVAVNENLLLSVLTSKDEAAQRKFRESASGIRLLNLIGNVLWMCAFGIPRSESVENRAGKVRLEVEADEDVRIGTSSDDSCVLRALRMDMEVYLSGDGASPMNVFIIALAQAVREGQRKDGIHVGQSLYDVVSEDVDMWGCCGRSASSLLGAIGGPVWGDGEGVNSRVDAASTIVRVLLVRRLALVALSMCGALAALSLFSAVL